MPQPPGVLTTVVVAGLIFAVTVQPIDAAPPAAASPELRANVKQMFDVGWDLTADGLTAAERSYRAAKGVAPTDPRVDYAWALLQLKYLKFNEAERTLADVIQADAGMWSARMLKIRLAVSMKKPTSALEQLEQLASAATDDADEAERAEAVEFVGRMFAFYEGPGARGVAATTVADARRRVAAGLASTDQQSFDRGFDRVYQQFLQLNDDKQRAQADAQATETRQKTADLQALAAEKQAVDAGRDAVRAQADESERRAREQVGQIDGELAPLHAALAQLNANGQLVLNQIAQLDATIASLLAQADAADDPAVRNSLLAQADLFAIRRNRARADYQALDIQATQINVQRGGLLQRRAQVESAYAAEMKQLGRTAVKLAGNEQRIATQTKAALQPATGRTPQVQTKETTTASVATYVELSLDREKQRLLSSLDDAKAR